MRTRPHTKFVRKLKALRCAKCGAKLHPQRRRCKRCATVVDRPKPKPAGAPYRTFAKH